jgi:signal transduction histidine kinase
MLGWIQMLRSGEMNTDSTSRGFDVLDRSVRLQSKLIEDLLDVSRIVAGKLRIEKRKGGSLRRYRQCRRRRSAGRP